MESALRGGLMMRVRPGLYALPDADPVIVRCAATNSRLTCASAAVPLGLWAVGEPAKVHLQRPDGTFQSDMAVVHRGSWERPRPGSHVASAVDAVVHALLCLPEPEALVIAESAVNRGLFSAGRLRDCLAGPGSVRASRTLDHLDRGADSLIETLARYHLRKAGLRVRPQVHVEGVGPMDLLVEECVDVETDGRLHERPSSRSNDYARDVAAQSLGIPTARFGYADVVRRPELMVERVKGLVAMRRALGPLPLLNEVETPWRGAAGSGLSAGA